MQSEYLNELCRINHLFSSNSPSFQKPSFTFTSKGKINIGKHVVNPFIEGCISKKCLKSELINTTEINSNNQAKNKFCNIEGTRTQKHFFEKTKMSIICNNNQQNDTQTK